MELKPILNTITINPSFQLASDFVNYTGASVFLTGKAGTGKTTFLKYIKESKVKNMAIVAPTGVAAINAGGTTIHSFFQLPFTPYIPGKNGFGNNETVNDSHNLTGRLKFSTERKEVMQNLDLLVIDEVSMVRCDVLDAIDLVLRHVRQQYNKSFGGVQVLLIGDMYQLPPVVNGDEWEILSGYYKSSYFFNSRVIEANNPVYVELDKIYRQSDEAFIRILNQVRNNELDKDGYELLHSRYLPGFHPPKEDNFITLTTHNFKADNINSRELSLLEGNSFIFEAIVEGEFNEKSFPADLSLQLKIGAQVMFVKNDTEKARRFFNGKIGRVSKIEEDKIFVECKDEPSLIEVKKEKWRNIRYSLDKASNKIQENEVGSFTQYPLRLAWAITIHKSQGLTFEKAIIDAGKAFAPGQVYVALSRCTSLQGIILHSRIQENSLSGDTRIAMFTQTQKTNSAQLQLLNEAKHQFQREELLSVFNFDSLLIGANAMVSFALQHTNSFIGELVSWSETICKLLEEGADVLKKFSPQLMSLLDDPELPEQNENLQKRITAAAHHFFHTLEKVRLEIKNCRAITDSKTMATDLNKILADLYESVFRKQYLISILKSRFEVNEFLMLKRNYSKQAPGINVYSGKSVYSKNESPHPELYNLLRKKRDDLCEEKDKPVYLVANSNTLDEMARYLPLTVQDLGKIGGFGKIRIHQFGQEFLSIINNYCEENNLRSNMNARSSKIIKKEKTKEVKASTSSLSLLLYKEGKSIAEIAKERNLATGTIEGHLSQYVVTGEIDIDELVPVSKQLLVKDAITKFGDGSPRTLIENLPPGFTYGEVRMVLDSVKVV